MAKSKVLKELANNDITLEVALNRLLIIASDIDNYELSQWAVKELNGYDNCDTIPSYRVVKNTLIKYSGINGQFKVTNAPLPLQNMFSGKDKEMFYMNLCEGIKTVQDFTSDTSGKQYGKDLTNMAGIVYEMSGIQCYSIQQIIPENAFADVINTVKTILIKIFLKLDKEYGNLDNLDIDTSDKTSDQIKQINTTINNFIYTDNSVSIGDKNRIEHSKTIGGGSQHE